MNQFLDFVHNNKVLVLGVGYIVASNIVAYLPKREEVVGQPLKGVLYDYFRNVVTGIMQMIPNPKPKTSVGPVSDSTVVVQK